MSLTPAEERELERINRELRALELEEEGDPAANEHIEAVARPACRGAMLLPQVAGRHRRNL